MRVLGGKPEGRRVLVVDLVDVLVEDTGVESLVGWGIPKTSATYPGVE